MVPNQMATEHPLPAPPAGQQHDQTANGGNGNANMQALVPVPQQEEKLEDPVSFSLPVSLLPVELDVVVPVREFRVRNLLALEPGQVIESQWGNGDDVPLASGEVQLAWSEFEVIDTQLAVRITRLA
jgi:flagellar motor switch/type III secretory pathway protein FliN